MTASGSGGGLFTKEIVPMIAIQKPNQRPTQSAIHAKFLKMLPAIRRQALFAFRKALPEAREELIAEVVAKAYRAFCRLVERGKEDVAFATPLALYSIRQVRSGRLLGGRGGLRDVMSARDQHRGFEIDRLGHSDQRHAEWQEVLVEDRKAGPAEIAACRIDFASWLRLLPVRLRKIALALRNSAPAAQGQVPCAAVFVFIGAEPSAEWLPAEIARDANGYLLTGTDVVRSGLWPRGDRDPCPLETTVPGVLAAGDIRSGATKRVGFAVGDGSLAVTCAHRLLSISR
jgi:hypothetical protein